MYTHLCSICTFTLKKKYRVTVYVETFDTIAKAKKKMDQWQNIGNPNKKM